MTRAVLLLNRAGRRREHSVRIRADQTNGTNHDYQNHGQHHGVFRDVLAVIVCPKFKDKIGHGNSSEWIFSTAGKLMLGDEPDQAIGNRTTDFNPDWIGMIVLLISEPVKI